MSKTVKDGLAISLIKICLCLFFFTAIASNVWSQDETKIQTFTNNLKDEDTNVRLKAAHALLKMGAEAKEAVPALIEALKDEDETVRWYAAEALDRRNTPEAQKALKEYKQKSN